MPSGPKKRKAARRKKEKENNNINFSSINNPLQGNDDLKSQDVKGSAGGENNSRSSAARPIASEVVLGRKEDGVVMIERDLKSKDGNERENGRFEYTETAKESFYVFGNGGGISNGESLAEKNSKDGIYNFLEQETVCHELVKSVGSSPSNMTVVKMNSPVKLEETGGNSVANDSVNSVKTVNSMSETEKLDLAGKMNEDSVCALPNEKATASSLEESKPKESNSEVLASSNGAEHTKDSETPKTSKNQPSVSSALNLAKKTSWWSCCGIFEVLSGSNK